MVAPKLLAGSSDRERAPADKRTAVSERWFEPLHVQDSAAARERIATQVAAGADIVIAPTWRTHRRALMAVGESRRAAEWTRAAVDVAREGVDAGLERRSGEASRPAGDAEVSDTPTGSPGPPAPPIEREPPLVAGVVPMLEDEPEPDTGRLLPPEPAAARDYEEAAGHLADADVDLILVETRSDIRGPRDAIEAAASTGIPTWAAATGSSDEDTLAAWTETAVAAGAAGILFPDGTDAIAPQLAESMAVATWGGLVGENGERTTEALREAADRWLAQGATVVGLLRGARPDRVAAIRAAIDQRILAEIEAARARTARWDAIVAEAAVMAPGGAALWIGPSIPASGSLPAGFAWTAVAPDEGRQLPTQRFRLIVADPDADVALAALADALEPGGFVVGHLSGAVSGHQGLRVLILDDRTEPPLGILRRED